MCICWLESGGYVNNQSKGNIKVVEDPRLREQEHGNIQDAEAMKKVGAIGQAGVERQSVAGKGGE